MAAVIDDHIGPLLVGEDGLATERLADMMFRMTKPYGSTGPAACAVSAIDLALWAAPGKVAGKPVYELLGGSGREPIFCYCTGNDLEWTSFSPTSALQRCLARRALERVFRGHGAGPAAWWTGWAVVLAGPGAAPGFGPDIPEAWLTPYF